LTKLLRRLTSIDPHWTMPRAAATIAELTFSRIKAPRKRRRTGARSRPALLAASGRHRAPAARRTGRIGVACLRLAAFPVERVAWGPSPGCLILYASRSASRALRVADAMACGHP
jgi:hypothetical protein